MILVHDLRGLRDRIDATIICPPSPELGRLEAEGFTIRRLAMERKIAPLADIRAIRRLRRMLRSGSYDVVHSFLPKGGLIGQIGARLARAPLTLHSCRGLLYTPTLSASRRALFQFTDAVTFHLADRVLFVSKADARLVTASHLCPRARARHTGTGIDLCYFDRRQIPPGARAALRDQLGIAPHARVVLTCGRMVIDKGYGDLVEAIPLVLDRVPEAHFLWVAPVLSGESGLLDERIIDERGLRRHVTILARQSDVRPYYACADVLAHPSHREGVPRVLMEAAALGLPIVASDVAGCREVVEDEQLGWLVRARNPQALADALVDALQNGEEAGRRAAAAAERAQERFNQERLCERVWDVYKELFTNARSSPRGAPC